MKYIGAVSGRDEDKIGNAKLHLDYYKDEVPYIDEGNFVMVCKKMSATRITEDQFIDPEIKEKWYADGNMHTMYIGEIVEIMAR
jgi:flavin reductase (DIM6/NTAB) family NADH-FMN oxidoreductase RutF